MFHEHSFNAGSLITPHPEGKATPHFSKYQVEVHVYIYCGGITGDHEIESPVLGEFWYVVRAQWPNHSIHMQFTGWQHKVYRYFDNYTLTVGTLVYSALHVGTSVYISCRLWLTRVPA